MNKFYRNPQGTLKIEKRDHSVYVTCGKEYSVECFDDNSWNLQLDTCDDEYKADLWHKAHGFPLWYGRGLFNTHYVDKIERRRGDKIL